MSRQGLYSLPVSKEHSIYCLTDPNVPVFSFPFFAFPSKSSYVWLKKTTKKKGCSVNTVGSLLMLEPDDGVVRELKDKDKDRKNWELGKNRRWLITSRTPKRQRGQEKSICGQKENPVGLFYFSKPCTVGVTWSLQFLHPVHQSWYWKSIFSTDSASLLDGGAGGTEEVKLRQKQEVTLKKSPEEEEQGRGAAAVSCKPQPLLKRLAWMLRRRQFYQKWTFPSSH